MSKIKIGIIGCGKQAPKHISGLRNIPGVELVLADIDPRLAEKLGKAENLPWAQSPDNLLADPAVSAVDVCTPTTSHYEIIKRAVEAGKHFFAEKPLCSDVEDAKRLQRAVEKKEIIGMVGYIYRFSPVLDLGKRLFENTPATGESVELGRIVSAFFRLGGRGSHQLWKHMKIDGGGAINEMLVHMIDLGIWYLGPVATMEVVSNLLLRPERTINKETHKVDAEDFTLVRAKMKSGVQAIFQADLVTPSFTQYLEIQGENGTFMASIQPDMPSFIYLLSPVGGYPSGKMPLNFGAHNLFEAQMTEFVKAVKAGRQPSRCTINDSILLMEALDMIKGKGSDDSN